MKCIIKKEIFQKILKISAIAILGALAIFGGATLLREVFFSQAGGLTPMTKSFPNTPISDYTLSNSGMESSRELNVTESVIDSGVTVVEQESFDGERKVVRQGDLSLRVVDASDATEEIRGIAQWHGGYAVSSNVFENPDGMTSGFITVKVPSEKLAEVMAGIKDLATIVVQESVSGDDVTEQYVDIEARLSNKRAEENAFQKILLSANDTDDIIKITREIARVRGEIEQMEARKRFMDSQIDMSSISVSLSEDQKVSFSDSWRPWQEVKASANRLLMSLQGVASLLIVFAVWFVPMAVLWLVIFGGIFLIGRKLWKKKK